ncbi:AAA family ATPase [Sphingomonas japonica]|uniref:DNA polymerase-3 subunit delta n=1 Tax=Sphingomonas japonica TaxID=511662 RepID=A0ABX0U5B3_9SPHN|nr:AAA family ATPase [Sphingomonas japonica]NIJ24861.1 DNA polymerase-3 subunit delta' [Sphingomonas japonica]
MTSIIGNAAAQAELRAALASPKLHHAWLFAGPEGVGKATLARATALRLLAQAADPLLAPDVDIPPQHRIRSLVEAGSHPDFRILQRQPKDPDKPDQDIARSIPIAQVRSLAPLFATKPSLSHRRVVLIDAIDDVERPGASNALLKMLEEPPEGTVFLLISHAPGRLLPTIRSRCRTLRFEPLANEQVEQVVRAALPEASDAETRAVVRAGNGSPGRALGFAGLDMASLERDLEAAATGGDPDNAIRTRLAKALSGKAAQPRYEAFLARVPSFVAAQACDRTGDALVAAIDTQAATRELGSASIGLTLDPATTVFQMVGHVASLAR